MKRRMPEQGQWDWRLKPHLTCLTYLTCLTGLTYLTCLTGLTYLTCLTGLTYLTCLTGLTYLTCLTGLTYLTCLTGLTYLTCLTGLTYLTCLTGLTYLTYLTCLTGLTYLTCLTGLTYLTCLTGLTYLCCLIHIACLTNILPWIDEAQNAGARSVGLKTSTSQMERTASTPVMATETYLPTRCSAHSRVSVSPSGNSLGIQSHKGFSLWVVELPTLTSACTRK
jgi:hypothetical protein